MIKEVYVVIAYLQTKYIAVLVEADSEITARWKGLLVLAQHGYETKNVNTANVYKIDVNDLVFNPSKREETE